MSDHPRTAIPSSGDNEMPQPLSDGWHDGCSYQAARIEREASTFLFCTKCGWGWSPAVIDANHLAHQREWSEATFGPGTRLHGVLDHIRKELAEIEADPSDLGEWVDVIILAFDGAWRAGWEPQEIIDAIKAKQVKNEAREWPDWRTQSDGKAIEHTPATLLDAIRKVMADAGEPITAVAVLDAINHRWPGAFPLASWLDVHDEMTEFYGAPS